MLTIGLIGAMDEEIALFVDHMDRPSESIVAGIRYIEGTYMDKRVVVCKSGVGKVNAAVCTQILIDRFEVGAVIFTGVAGALDPRLSPLDVVISADCMQHDMDVTALGFPVGTIPYQDNSIFTADPELVRIAEDAGAKLGAGLTIVGRILSGDQFIADSGKVKQLHEQLQGACTEMEGAAVAQACFMNAVPFVVIRSMSDKADGSAEINFSEFTEAASERSFRIVSSMIPRI